MITMKDVARLARVSPITVSRTLSNPESVKPETRKKVLEAVENLQYKPNHIARSLATNRTNIIGVLLSNITNPFYPEFLLGLETKARSLGWSVIICNANDFDTASRNLELLLEKRVDGIVVTSLEFASNKLKGRLLKNLERMVLSKSISTSIVMFETIPSTTTLSCIQVDNYLAGHIAMEHLHGLGHKNIAHISHQAAEWADYGVWIERIRAFKDAQIKIGIEPKETMIELVPSEDVQVVVEATRRLLKLNPRPSAIFAANDMLAVGVLQAAYIEKVRVPEELSIIGIDGIPIGNQVFPRLTTVAYPQYKLGEASANMLIEQIEGRTDGMNITFKPVLEVRESTAPPGLI